MRKKPSIKDKFISKLTEIIEANLTNEKFGVSFLAREMGISRAALYRKVKFYKKISVSKLICKIRLKHAMELLQQNLGTVSEIAYEVGFSSATYFSKCFHDYYGFSPGEASKNSLVKKSLVQPNNSNKKLLIKTLFSVTVFIVLVILLLITFKSFVGKQKSLEKSVAILPPNYSSSNYKAYIIDGIMEALYNKLALIQDLTISPSTSIKKYRDKDITIPQISKELNVNYIVESSGIVFNDSIRIIVTLINTVEHKPIWTERYIRSIQDIFILEDEISEEIAQKINAQITPVELKRINKKPTQNRIAYNYYLQGIQHKKDSLKNAIICFEKAIENDHEFALAFAQLAITYYMLNYKNNNKKYSMEININADKAILFAPQHDMSLISKAYDYINKGENKLAIPFLEQAILYNPNSAISYRMLANLYNLVREANTEKYLEYKLRAINLSSIEHDSIQQSEDYRLAARALRVAGFYNQALQHIEKSIELNPSNFSSICEKGDIIIERDTSYIKAREILINALNKDSLNVEVLRSLFTNHYLSRDYKGAYYYYKKIFEIDNKISFLNPKDYSRLSVVFHKLNMQNESETFLNYFKERDRSKLNSYVKSIEMIRLYCLENNKEKALEQLNIFNQHKYHFVYSIRMLKDDAVFDNIRALPEYKKIFSEIEDKFWTNHNSIRISMVKKGLLFIDI